MVLAMGHHISAVLLSGPFDDQRAPSLDLRPIRLTPTLTLFPLDYRYVDFWSEKLGIAGFVSGRPLLNAKVIHHMVKCLALSPLFAVIETDYLGVGSQAAAVYRGDVEIMRPESTAIGPVEKSSAPINKALRQLGIVAHRGRDEFDSVGLGRHRDFCDLFEAYGDRE
jgi:hypothetical protein